MENVRINEDKEVFINSLFKGNCSYDKKQEKYIYKHGSERYKNGFKFIYGYSLPQLEKLIEIEIMKDEAAKIQE